MKGARKREGINENYTSSYTNYYFDETHIYNFRFVKDKLSDFIKQLPDDVKFWISYGLNDIEKCKAPIIIYDENRNELKHNDVENIPNEKLKKLILNKIKNMKAPPYFGIITVNDFVAYDIDTKENVKDILTFVQSLPEKSFYLEETANGYHIIFKVKDISKSEFSRTKKIAVFNGKEFSRHRNKFLITFPTVRYDKQPPQQIKPLCSWLFTELNEISVEDLKKIEGWFKKILKESGWEVKEEQRKLESYKTNLDNSNFENEFYEIYKTICEDFKNAGEDKGWRSDLIFALTILCKLNGLEPEKAFELIKSSPAGSKLEEPGHDYNWFIQYEWEKVQEPSFGGFLGALKDAYENAGIFDEEKLAKYKKYNINKPVFEKMLWKRKEFKKIKNEEVEVNKTCFVRIYKDIKDTYVCKREIESYIPDYDIHNVEEYIFAIFKLDKEKLQRRKVYDLDKIKDESVFIIYKNEKEIEINLDDLPNFIKQIKCSGVKEQNFYEELKTVYLFVLNLLSNSSEKYYTYAYGITKDGCFIPPQWKLYEQSTPETDKFEKLFEYPFSKEELKEADKEVLKQIKEIATKVYEYLDGDYASKVALQFCLASIFGRYLLQKNKIEMIPSLVIVGSKGTGKTTRIGLIMRMLKNSDDCYNNITEFAFMRIQNLLQPAWFEEVEKIDRLAQIIKASSSGNVANPRGKSNQKIVLNRILRNIIYTCNTLQINDPAVLDRMIILDMDSQAFEIANKPEENIVFLKKNIHLLGAVFWKNIEYFKEYVDEITNKYIIREEAKKEFLKIGGAIAKKFFEIFGLNYQPVEYINLHSSRVYSVKEIFMRELYNYLNELDKSGKIYYPEENGDPIKRAVLLKMAINNGNILKILDKDFKNNLFASLEREGDKLYLYITNDTLNIIQSRYTKITELKEINEGELKNKKINGRVLKTIKILICDESSEEECVEKCYDENKDNDSEDNLKCKNCEETTNTSCEEMPTNSISHNQPIFHSEKLQSNQESCEVCFATYTLTDKSEKEEECEKGEKEDEREEYEEKIKRILKEKMKKGVRDENGVILIDGKPWWEYVDWSKVKNPADLFDDV